MRIIIKTILISMTLISLSSFVYAADDSASSDARPKIVIARKSVPQVDTSKCIQNSDSGWMSMASSGDDGIITYNYAPTQCPANYAMVKQSDYRINHGIYVVAAPFRYLVRDTYDSKTITCCPVLATWVNVV